MTSENWAGLTALVAAVGAVGLKFVKWFFPWLKKQSGKRDVVKGIQQIHRLYEVMQDAHDTLEAHRVILWTAHNTGGVPRANAPFYASALHWTIDKKWSKQYARPLENVADYTHLPVDAAYISMLCTLMEDGDYHYESHKHDDNTMLAEIYKQSGATDSYIVLLGFHANKMFYVSFARYDGKFTGEQKTALYLKANLMKAILDETLQ